MSKLLVGGVGCAVVALSAGVASATVSMSALGGVGITFNTVVEDAPGTQVGRTGLLFTATLGGGGYVGGDAPDSIATGNLGFGFDGGFPDGFAPVNGSGLHLSYEAIAGSSLAGTSLSTGLLFYKLSFKNVTETSIYTLTCTFDSLARFDGSVGRADESGDGSVSTYYELSDFNGYSIVTTLSESRNAPVLDTVFASPAGVTITVAPGDTAEFTMTIDTLAETAKVPAPSSVALGAASCMVLAVRRRRR